MLQGGQKANSEGSSRPSSELQLVKPHGHVHKIIRNQGWLFYSFLKWVIMYKILCGQFSPSILGGDFVQDHNWR